MLDVVYRGGDVIRFRRGSNEYVGTIVRIHGVLSGLKVAVPESPRGWMVKMKDVVQIVEPVLTEKEMAAIHALAAEFCRSRAGATVRELKASGAPVYGTTLHGLAQRGLVTSVVAGIEGAARRSTVWELTEEGSRVAAALI